MSKREEKEIVAALDIGTSKIAVIVAEADAQNNIEVIGMGTHPSRGMKKGLVVNVEELSEAIGKAVAEAENMADCSIREVLVGISGANINSTYSHGLVAGARREITADDVRRAIDVAKQYNFAGAYDLLHCITREFTLDEMKGIKQPVGMSGVRLEADVLLIGCPTTALQNLNNCLQRCQVGAGMVILEQIASSESVLGRDECELGVCLVDIGGGTTDIAVFCDGIIQHIKVVPIAGDHVTRDIAIALRTPTTNAEDIKCRYGTVSGGEDAGENLEVPGVGERAPRSVSRGTLAEIIRPRYEELFELVQGELVRHNFDSQKLVSGVVLTGGSSQIPGLCELAEEVFHMPVRVGRPQGIDGFGDMLTSPVYATGVGLLLYGLRHQDEVAPSPLSPAGLWEKIKNFF